MATNLPWGTSVNDDMNLNKAFLSAKNDSVITKTKANKNDIYYLYDQHADAL